MKLHKIYSILFLFVISSCYAMEPEERINPTKMALAKKHGLIGYTIKQIGITYNEDGSVCNPPYDGLITDRIIEFIKLSLAKNLLFETKIPYKPAPDVYVTKDYDLSIAQNPCKPEIALASEDEIILWDLKNHSNMSQLIPPHRDDDGNRISLIAYSPTGRQLATKTKGDYVDIWDLETKNVIHSLVPNKDCLISKLLFSHDGTKLLINTWDENINVYDVTNDFTLTAVLSSLGCFNASNVMRGPDGKKFAGEGHMGPILWDLESSSKEIYTLPTKMYRQAFNHNGTQIICVCNHYYKNPTYDNDPMGLAVLHLNKPNSNPEIEPITDQPLPIEGLAYCSQIDKYFCATTNAIITIDPHNFTISVQKLQEGINKGCIFSEDGSKLADIIYNKDGREFVIRYRDLVPDLKSYTIEELSIMQQQQKTSLNN